jgi:hypothetical protein
MNKDDPRYAENFVALVRAAEEDEFRDVPDERLRAAVQAALAAHPEDAWTDGTFTQVGAAFFAAVHRNAFVSTAPPPRITWRAAGERRPV